MSREEPRPREPVVGERADRRRVSEAEHYFPMQGVQRLDRRTRFGLDQGPRRPAAASRAGSSSVARQDHQRAPVARANLAGAMSVLVPSRRRIARRADDPT